MRMRIVRLFICLFILMMINACKPFYSQKSSPNDVIKIGFAYPYELDQEIKKSKGLFMAVKEMNAKGGIKGKKIVVTAIDDYGTVTGGLKAAHHLIADQNVLAVSGHYNSRVAKAVIPLYQKSGV
nr:ABC transporter substrate-binding protein [Candidatus Cloacimonadota bacterium]